MVPTISPGLSAGSGSDEHLGPELAALERGERAELERVDAVVDRVQRGVDQRDRQRAAAARVAVGGDVDDPERGAEHGRDQQREPERAQGGEHGGDHHAPAAGDGDGAGLGRRGEDGPGQRADQPPQQRVAEGLADVGVDVAGQQRGDDHQEREEEGAAGGDAEPQPEARALEARRAARGRGRAR